MLPTAIARRVLIVAAVISGLAVTGCTDATAPRSPAISRAPTPPPPTGPFTSAIYRQLGLMGITLSPPTRQPVVGEQAALAVARASVPRAVSTRTAQVRLDRFVRGALACTCWVIVWSGTSTQAPALVTAVDSQTGRWLGNWAPVAG